MKNRILISFLLCLIGFISQAQVYYNRTNGLTTPVDPHLGTTLSFKVPVLADTTHALAAAGIDSLGIIFKERFTPNFWVRDTILTGGHKWTLISNGSDTAVVSFGSILGSPYDNTSLANALNGKQTTIVTGTTAQYFRGDLSLATFPTLLSQFTNDLDFIDSVIVQYSIQGNGNGTPLQLVGDAASPGATKYYGTNGGGSKGWYTLPSSGTGSVTSIATISPILGGTITTTGTISLDTSIVHSISYYNTIYYPLSSNPSGFYKATDTVSTLATKFYVNNHSSTNVNVGSAYRFAIATTNNIKTAGAGYGITIDSATTNQIGFKADTATLFPAVRATIASAIDSIFFGYWGTTGDTLMSAGGTDTIYSPRIRDTLGFTHTINGDKSWTLGSKNTNVGSGYRVGVNGTANLKTLFVKNGIIIDSSSNTNGLTLQSDTSLLATQYDVSLKLNKSDTVNMLLPYLRKSDTTAMLSSYARKNFISGAAPVSYSSSTGIISVDTTTALIGLATQADVLNNSTNSNIGSGYRWVIPGGNSIKTLFVTNGIIVDSTTNTNALTLKSDTSLLATQYDNGLKLNKSDTSGMLLSYLRKSDTTAMLNPYLHKVDTTNKWVTQVLRSNDTVYYIKGGIRVFAFLDSLGGGGGSTLTRQVITSGTSGTVTGGNYLVTFDPASAISAYTLMMPASPSDLQTVEIDAGGTITSGIVISTFTLVANSGQTLLQASTPNGIVAAGSFVGKWRYRTSTSQWYRQN